MVKSRMYHHRHTGCCHGHRLASTACMVNLTIGSLFAVVEHVLWRLCDVVGYRFWWVCDLGCVWDNDKWWLFGVELLGVDGMLVWWYAHFLCFFCWICVRFLMFLYIWWLFRLWMYGFIWFDSFYINYKKNCWSIIVEKFKIKLL